ncbi:MAG: hypothetical protein KAI57_01040 [Candidatus Pacebacteria bacterium]|nr:hypothetical protein [Candidatus Paceibacterota bacterium]
MHPFADKPIEEVEKEIIEKVKAEKSGGDFSFTFLKMRLRESCDYITMGKALNSLIEKDKVIRTGDGFFFGSIMHRYIEVL